MDKKYVVMTNLVCMLFGASALLPNKEALFKLFASIQYLRMHTHALSLSLSLTVDRHLHFFFFPEGKLYWWRLISLKHTDLLAVCLQLPPPSHTHLILDSVQYPGYFKQIFRLGELLSLGMCQLLCARIVKDSWKCVYMYVCRMRESHENVIT